MMKMNKKAVILLSGGLDSRLVLSKIKELGYENIFVFSYGVKNNHDAMTAKKMCKKLNIPWHFEINSTTNSRNFFKSSLRQCYFQFANQRHIFLHQFYDAISMVGKIFRTILRPPAVLIFSNICF